MSNILSEVVSAITGNVYPPGRRTQLSVAYSHLVLEHHSAIAYLAEIKHFASAFALARPIYEATVKGLWLFHRATDEQLEAHVRGRELNDIAKLIEQLSEVTLPSMLKFSLSQIRARDWKTLSSLTHIGHAQLKNWINDAGVQPSYSEAAVWELSNFGNFMAVVAGRELASRAGNDAGVKLLADILPEESRRGI